MKFDRRYVIIAVLCVFLLSSVFGSMGFAHAATYDDTDYNHVLTSTISTIPYTQFNLMLDSDTPLTLRYIIDNPDFTITVIPSADSGSSAITITTYGYVVLLTEEVANIFNYSKLSSYWKNLDSSSALLDAPIYIYNRSGVSSCSYTVYISQNADGTTTPTEPEETEPEETTPVVPDDGGEDNSGLLDGIKDFFTDLFAPIIKIIDSFNSMQESELTVWEALEKLSEYVKGYTLEPILEFFESILLNDAVLLIIQVWEFPIVKEFLLFTVAVLVIGGFLKLLTTL